MSTSQPRPVIYNNKYKGTTHDQPQAVGGGTITGYKSGEHSVASHFGHIMLKAADGTMTKDQGVRLITVLERAIRQMTGAGPAERYRDLNQLPIESEPQDEVSSPAGPGESEDNETFALTHEGIGATAAPKQKKKLLSRLGALMNGA